MAITASGWAASPSVPLPLRLVTPAAVVISARYS
jgi:hypothetical protein